MKEVKEMIENNWFEILFFTIILLLSIAIPLWNILSITW